MIRVIPLALAFISGSALAAPSDWAVDRSAELMAELQMMGVTPPNYGFCSALNPEFANNGGKCCGKLPRRGRGGRPQCDRKRRSPSFCSEMSDEQRLYTRLAESGKLGDVLSLIQESQGKLGPQSYCLVNNGFLVNGRRLIATPENRLVIQRPSRCTDFGTDALIGMMEWVGRQIAKDFTGEMAGTKLIVGQLSSPRGGCLTGLSGRRGHLSHTSGLDVDFAFLQSTPNRESPIGFTRTLDAAPNWWLLKKIFQNPFACVRIVFVDRRHIARMAKVARDDPEWETYRRFIRHERGHRDHFHVRVGMGPGQPGCVPGAKPELEPEDAPAEESPQDEDAPDESSVSPDGSPAASPDEEVSDEPFDLEAFSSAPASRLPARSR